MSIQTLCHKDVAEKRECRLPRAEQAPGCFFRQNFNDINDNDKIL